MKKIVSALIIAALFICCMVPAAFAADSATVTVSSATANAGDTVKLTVSISEAQFAGFGMTINYDSAALQLTKITNGGLVEGMFFGNPKTGKVSCTGAGLDMDGNLLPAVSGTLFTAEFKVLDAATACGYPVTVTVGNVTNGLGEALNVSVAGGVVAINGGAHVYGEWVTTDATCDKDGAKTATCTICGATTSETIDALGHAWGEWTETKAAACGVAGEETRTCATCQETETRATAALEHAWGEWTETKAATCGEAGEETRTCATCQKTETRAIAALAHAWGEWTETKAPTCTEAGEKTRTCSVCNEVETAAVDALGHAWGDWTVTKEATTEAEGEEERVCSVCGEVEKRAIPKVPVVVEPDLDDVPGTGDITIQLTAGIAVVVVAMFAAVAFVFKRKAAK